MTLPLSPPTGKGSIIAPETSKSSSTSASLKLIKDNNLEGKLVSLLFESQAELRVTAKKILREFLSLGKLSTYSSKGKP
jgi:hypothetical protein